jgi:hypothetical protein
MKHKVSVKPDLERIDPNITSDVLDTIQEDRGNAYTDDYDDYDIDTADDDRMRGRRMEYQ